MIKQVLGRIYRKTVGLKQRLGFYGDILVVILIWWMVKQYVPYGKVLIDAVMYLFGALVIFSVLYVLWLRVRHT